LILEVNAAKPPIRLEEESRVEVLLRLPIGVQLVGEGWKSVELPPEEKDDPSGPWVLFELENQLLIPPLDRTNPDSGATSFVKLASVPLKLAVVEEGMNWVVNTRVRLIQRGEAWQTFGTVFVTFQEGVAEFTAVPRRSLPLPGEEAPPDGGTSPDENLEEAGSVSVEEQEIP